MNDRYGRRSNDPDGGRLKRETRAIILALAIQLAGCVFSAGILYNQIATMDARVHRVEAYFDAIIRTNIEKERSK
jgi:hypothetical protein